MSDLTPWDEAAENLILASGCAAMTFGYGIIALEPTNPIIIRVFTGALGLAMTAATMYFISGVVIYTKAALAKRRVIKSKAKPLRGAKSPGD